ncbi:hypothetical protein VTL71DRAFT_7906 [Oculimacula yallundae]|uniref:Protein kinase domain-containing protein n=1 Tax=Oculimacula yallundae TaxID=86028 RepID=A0ABR4CWF5_9HELO
MATSLEIGQNLSGKDTTYSVIRCLKNSVIYKGKITARSSPNGDLDPMSPGDVGALYASFSVFWFLANIPFSVILKAAGKFSGTQFKTESHLYAKPSIRTCPHIRKHLETIQDSDSNPYVQVYEWMDGDLLEDFHGPSADKNVQARAIARGVLGALQRLHEQKLVHNDVDARLVTMPLLMRFLYARNYLLSLSEPFRTYKDVPRNIFASNFDCPNRTVKLGDLGIVKREAGLKGQFLVPNMCHSHLAPEIHRGLPASSKSDIWAVGVMLADWLASTPIFGYDKAAGKPDFIRDYMVEINLARIMILRGDPGPPDSSFPGLNELFLRAAEIALGEHTDPHTQVKRGVNQSMKTLREELESRAGSSLESGCIDFIESLLTVDPESRPSAREALQHSWLQDHGEGKASPAGDNTSAEDASSEEPKLDAQTKQTDVETQSTCILDVAVGKMKKAIAKIKKMAAETQSKVKAVAAKLKRRTDSTDREPDNPDKEPDTSDREPQS